MTRTEREIAELAAKIIALCHREPAKAGKTGKGALDDAVQAALEAWRPPPKEEGEINSPNSTLDTDVDQST